MNYHHIVIDKEDLGYIKTCIKMYEGRGYEVVALATCVSAYNTINYTLVMKKEKDDVGDKQG